MQNRRKTERAALDLPSFEASDYLRQPSHLPNHHIPVRHEPVLTEKYSRKKVRDGSNAGNADAFTAQLLDPLNVRLGHREDQHPVYGYGDIDRVRSRESGVYTRWPANRGYVDTSPHKCLHCPGPAGDINELNIKPVALEYPRLLGNPRYRKGRSDRRVSDSEFLQCLSAMTRASRKQDN
jgi:hypothetical protein